MTQNPTSPCEFTVANGEQVSVTVQAVQCQCLTSAAYNQADVAAAANNPDVYQFTVAGNSGDQFRFACVCTFQAGDPLFAYYAFAVGGNNGGNCSAPEVPKELPEASQVLYFTVL